MLPPAGDLPLPVIALFCSIQRDENSFNLRDAGPGFTLPANIGDLDPAITELDLRGCNLTGTVCVGIIWLSCLLFHVFFAMAV